MPRQPDNWPAGALPRGFDVKQAAYYVGLSPGTFLKRVRQGTFPDALQIGRRKIWDRTVLDAAMDRLSGRRAQTTGGADAAEEEAIAVMMQRRRAAGRQVEERIVAAHRAGETSREIGAREKMSPQKVASIIRWHKR